VAAAAAGASATITRHLQPLSVSGSAVCFNMPRQHGAAAGSYWQLQAVRPLGSPAGCQAAVGPGGPVEPADLTASRVGDQQMLSK
jgi:hypothetical protein